MSLVVGTNSWVTIDEADDHLKHKIATTAWFLLDPTGSDGAITKENLLITAFNELKGIPNVEISDSSTDENVKKAQIEYAWYYYNHYEEIDERRAAISNGVTSYKIDDRSENFNINNVGIPGFILGMLTQYVTSNQFADLKGEYDT